MNRIAGSTQVLPFPKVITTPQRTTGGGKRSLPRTVRKETTRGRHFRRKQRRKLSPVPADDSIGRIHRTYTDAPTRRNVASDGTPLRTGNDIPKHPVRC